MSNSEIRTSLLHLRDSDDQNDQTLIKYVQIVASIIGISQMQRAQCGFQSFACKREGLFCTV